jgi:hypothetical protein
VVLAARVEGYCQMPLLRMREASFSNASVSAGPVTLDLGAGRRAALRFETAQQATVVALMASGIAKASNGCVLVGDYDPRVQSVHCKRIAAFVAHDPLGLDDAEFSRYVAYRAALWSVDLRSARTRARELLERLDGMHEAFAYPLIGALIAKPQLLVMDRPAPVYARNILGVIDDVALLTTHVHAGSVAAFER